MEVGIRTFRQTGTPAPARSGRWRDQADFTARLTSADVTPMATVPRIAATMVTTTRANIVTVTMADGSKLEGKLVRKDDFLVILTLADGTRRSIARHDSVPKVEVKDPNEAHKKMVLALDDSENKNLHDVTAYLATLK